MPERQAVEMVLQPCLKVLSYLHEQVRGHAGSRRGGEGGRRGVKAGERVHCGSERAWIRGTGHAFRLTLAMAAMAREQVTVG